MTTPFPHDMDAERALLTCVADDPTLVGLLGVQPDEFHKPSHGTIYRAIEALSRERRPVDPTTLQDQLNRTGDLDAAGGFGAVADICTDIVVTGRAQHYAAIVQDYAHRRRMLAASMNLTEALLGGAEEEARAECADTLRDSLAPKTVDHVSPESRAAAFMERYANDDPMFLPVPLDKWREVGRGVPLGCQTIIGARPSVGKTAFACFLAIGMALEDHPVLIQSCESPAEQLHRRMLVQLSWMGTDFKPRDPLTHDAVRFKTADPAKVRKWSDELAGLPIFVEDRLHALPRLEANARAMVYSRGVKAIFLDHVSKVRVSGIRGDGAERRAIGATSQRYADIAHDLDVATVLLSQLNREAEGSMLPTLAHLRMSGDLEQDADEVILLAREDRSKPYGRFCYRKGRDGQADYHFDYSFQGEYLAFADLDECHSPPDEEPKERDWHASY